MMKRMMNGKTESPYSYLFCALSPGSPCSLLSSLSFQDPKAYFLPTNSNAVIFD